MQTEEKPSAVPRTSGATQDGISPERDNRWSWVEPAVWTRRMLSALDEGVKGGVWFSLMDKVYAPRNLEAAFRKVASNKGSAGVDRVTVGQYSRNLESELERAHSRPGQMGAHATSVDPAQTTQRERAWTRDRASTLAQCLFQEARAVQPGSSACPNRRVPLWVTHQLEIRMRETRPYGSEGGGAGQPALPTPIAGPPRLPTIPFL
jgi:hypothetical protein